MDLRERLIQIKNKYGLNSNTLLSVKCSENITLKGTYDGYTQAIDNEPEIASIDIRSEDGTLYEIMENEIVELSLLNN